LAHTILAEGQLSPEELEQRLFATTGGENGRLGHEMGREHIAMAFEIATILILKSNDLNEAKFLAKCALLETTVIREEGRIPTSQETVNHRIKTRQEGKQAN
jgi:hypothetical protein